MPASTRKRPVRFAAPLFSWNDVDNLKQVAEFCGQVCRDSGDRAAAFKVTTEMNDLAQRIERTLPTRVTG